jgi:hypothetical protein
MGDGLKPNNNDFLKDYNDLGKIGYEYKKLLKPEH